MTCYSVKVKRQGSFLLALHLAYRVIFYPSMIPSDSARICPDDISAAT